MELELERTPLDGFASVLEATVAQEETVESIVPDACPDLLGVCDTEGVVCLHRKEAMEGRESLAQALSALAAEHHVHEHEHDHDHAHEHEHEHAHEHAHEHEHAHDYEHDHAHVHHYDQDGVCACGHHHDHGHDADQVFTSWGVETVRAYAPADLSHMLAALDGGAYGQVLRGKGIVAGKDGQWLHFDYVPGEAQVRKGTPGVTGRLCVIGAQLQEEALASLFEVA